MSYSHIQVSKRLLIGVAVMAVFFLVGCSELNDSFLNPKGPIAAEQKTHLIQVTLYSMIAMLPVLILVPILLWRYRYKNSQACYKPDWGFSRGLDLVMWGVPFAIVSVLSVLLWHSTKTLDPYKPIASPRPALEVQVVGLDWKWLFIYPQYGIASIGEMAFATDRPVALKLTSDTVMQSFLISSLAGQIYTMPGMETQLHLKADQPGVFEGENTQFNGTGFSEQKFNAVGMSAADFDHWVATVRSEGVVLNDAVYDFLGNRSTPQEVYAALGTEAMPQSIVYFKNVSPDLYNGVIGRYHSGVAIPPDQQPGGALFYKKSMNPAKRAAIESGNATGVLQ